MRVKQLFLIHTVITTIITAALLVWEFWSILLIQIFDLLLSKTKQEHLISFATFLKHAAHIKQKKYGQWGCMKWWSQALVDWSNLRRANWSMCVLIKSSSRNLQTYH